MCYDSEREEVMTIERPHPNDIEIAKKLLRRIRSTADQEEIATAVKFLLEWFIEAGVVG